MPNWCDNTMTVAGTAEEIEVFVELMISDSKTGDGTDLSVLDFEAVSPMPRVLRGRKSTGDDGFITWYDWALEEWGTKWNAVRAELDYAGQKNKGVAVYRFQTAWGPPITWQQKIIEYFPWLEFEFDWQEEGMGFAGEMSGIGGVASEIIEKEMERVDGED